MEIRHLLRGRPSGSAALLPLLVVLGACQTFSPVQTVTIGDEIRARLTTAEAIRQSEVTGEPIRVLEGTVTGSAVDRIELAVVTARGQRLTESFQYSTSYSLPLDGVEEMSLREISPLRTGILLSLLGGALYWVLDSTVIGGGGTEDVGVPPDLSDWIARFLPGR